MAVVITVRNIPDEVRDVLAARAARSGRSLQEHLRAELIALAAKPSVDDLLDGVRARKASTRTTLSADDIVALRDHDRR